MILQSVSLESWRCFDNLSRFDFDLGLNIVHAPNGSGKSSLFESIRDAFLLGHDSNTAEIRSIVPWGATLGPFVQIDFSDNGDQYRLVKKFLIDRKSLLLKKSGTEFRKLVEGKNADDAVIRILDRALDTGKKEKWLLSKILLAHQGRIEIDSLSDDLQKNIRTVLSAQVGGVGAYEDLVKQRYSTYFTPTGKPKTGKDAPQTLNRSKAELDHTLEQLQNARRDYESFESLSSEVAELAKRMEISAEQLNELEAEQVSLEKLDKKYQELLGRKRLAVAERAKEQLVYKDIENRIAEIEKYSKLITVVQERIDHISRAIPEKQREHESLTLNFRALEEKVLSLKSSEESLTGRRQLIQAAREFVGINRELDLLQDKKRQSDALIADIQQKRSVRSTIKAPDKKTLASIRKLLFDKADVERKLEMSLLRLELTPEKDLSVEVTRDGHTITQPLTENVSVEFSGSPFVIARIPGVVAMKVSGPVNSLEDEKKALTQFRTELANISNLYGTTDVNELEKLLEQASEIDSEIKTLERDLKKLLGNDDQDSIDLKIESHQKELSGHLLLNPDWKSSIPDPDEMERDNHQALRDLKQKLKELEEPYRKADMSRMTLLAELERLPGQLSQAEEDLQNSREELRKRQEDGKSAEDRLSDLNTAAMRLRAADIELESVDNDLKVYGESPEEKLAALTKKLDHARNMASSLNDEFVGKTAILESESAKAPYSKITTLEEKAQDLQKLYERELLRQDAIKLLNETLEKHRQQALSGITEPVELRATQIMARIGGRKFSHVNLRQNFVPEAVQPSNVPDSVSVENMSGGEKEQLHLAVRLALAETLTKDQRHFMLLDDVLTATDSSRMDRILGILEDMADHFQVIVMTCHPERYRKITSAKFIDLLTGQAASARLI